MSNDQTRGSSAPRRTAAILDDQFDRLVPDELRHLSSIHWTPVQVAIRVVALLSPTPKTMVLDVGSGVGKLCSMGAVSSDGVWVGVEHHEPFVRTARSIARTLGVAERTWFLRTDAFAIDWSSFDALYFYNPFEFALSDNAANRASGIGSVLERLAALPNHTRVVTLHGFGGVMPSTFELNYYERLAEFGVDLALWKQRRQRIIAGVAL